MTRPDVAFPRIPKLIALFTFTAMILIASAAMAQPVSLGRPAGKAKHSPARAQAFSLFQPAVIYSSGGYWGQAIAAGDFNGDGIPDLAMANVAYCSPYPTCADGVVGILLGNGDGTFRPAVGYDTGGYWATTVVVADVNADGKLDLVVANCSESGVNCGIGSGVVAVLLGNGDGTFRPAVGYNLIQGGNSEGSSSLTLADVNGDGILDIVTSGLAVLLGNGDGTFQPAIYAQGNGGDGVAVADLNGDGKPDLVVTITRYDTIGISLGNGDGTFRQQALYASGGGWPSAVMAADVNGDGKLDLLVANEGSSSDQNGFAIGVGTASVFFGNGDGTFQPAVLYPSSFPNYHSIALADVNGDGKPDLLLAGCSGGSSSYCGNGGDGSLSVLLGNGDGTFQPAQYFDSGSVGGVSIVVADFNRDGRLDVALANWFDGSNGQIASVGVLLNSTGTTTALASSPNPSLSGQAVTLTATVKSPGGNPPNGEYVSFNDGPSALGTGPLSGGIAQLAISSLTVGQHTITAAYGGDGIYVASTSAPLTQKVLWSTATSLISSPNPSAYAHDVTFTATITSPGGLPPSGENVTFYDGSSPIGTAVLRAGVAILESSSLSVGTHAITAVYPGDATFASSGSSPISQIVVRLAVPWPPHR